MPKGIYIRTEEVRKILSESAKARKNRFISEETKLKIANSLKGKKHSEERRINQSKAHIGKKHSKEQTIKISLANKGKKRSEVFKLRMKNIWSSLERRRKASEIRKGSKSPNWQGGLTSINNRIRQSLDYRIWRMAVFERDKYTCQECGDNKGGNLNAHHIKPFSKYAELRFDINNGKTLCIDCHKETDTYLNRW